MGAGADAGAGVGFGVGVHHGEPSSIRKTLLVLAKVGLAYSG